MVKKRLLYGKVHALFYTGTFNINTTYWKVDVEHIELTLVICYNLKTGHRWCSILVGTSVFENGAKNPFKGISMKFLVLAADAQLGVGAGS